MDNSPGKDLRWDPIRYFVAVVKAGSVVGAARRLGVGHATVLRNIARLEASLGLRLFDHVRSGYRITADGEEVYVGALAMEAEAEALLRRALGRDPTPEGVLKLVVGDNSLFDPMPLLQRFRDAQPAIELTVEDAEGEAERQIAQLRADVAVLVTNSPPDDLVGRQIARAGFAFYAAPAYLAGRPLGELRPEACRWVTWTMGSSSELDDAWHAGVVRRLVGNPDVALHADRHAAAHAAVRAGVGVGLLSTAGDSGLVRLPFPEPRENVGVWLLTHPDLRRSGRVRAFFDFVAEEFQAVSAAL